MKICRNSLRMVVLLIFLLGVVSCQKQVKQDPLAGNFVVTSDQVTTEFSDKVKPLAPLPDDWKPLQLPKTPRGDLVFDTEGKEWAAFDQRDMNILLNYRDVSESNTQLAQDLKKVAATAIESQNAAVEAGKLEEQRANHNAQVVAAREKQLKHEKRMRWLERWLTRAAVVLSFWLGTQID